jgi:3-phenylpropionate/trans-cinnamate dioxygenase ferredoxin reductase subunit
MQRIVIVGASLAGTHAAEALRDRGFAGSLTVVGDEPHRPYDRPPLSKQLLGADAAATDVALPAADAVDADWLLGTAATGLDLARRTVRLDGGDELPFDGLVIATGVRPRRLATLDGLPDVHTLRTLDDSARLSAALQPGTHLLIVGAGFIGVEVATAARARGCAVTIVSLDPPVAAAGPEVSAACTEMLLAAGVRLRIGHKIAAADDQAVVLDDGTTVAYDAALVAVGAIPNTEWLAGSGLDLTDGVLCDASLAAVGATGVVAAGDLARWPNPLAGGRPLRVEHWTNAVEHGAAAARTLLEGSGPGTVHASVPDFWSDHFGTRLQSVGFLRDAVRYEVVEGARADRRFAATAHDEQGEVVGAVAYAMPRTIVRHRLALSRTGATP